MDIHNVYEPVHMYAFVYAFKSMSELDCVYQLLSVWQSLTFVFVGFSFFAVFCFFLLLFYKFIDFSVFRFVLLSPNVLLLHYFTCVFSHFFVCAI